MFGCFLQKLQNELGVSHTIDSLLLEPVQRFPKYKMVITDAEKKFKKMDDVENAQLMSKTLNYVDEICTYANDMIYVGYITEFNVSYKTYDRRLKK